MNDAQNPSELNDGKLWWSLGVIKGIETYNDKDSTLK